MQHAEKSEASAIEFCNRFWQKSLEEYLVNHVSGAFQTQITLPYREPIFAQGSVEDVVEAINRVYNIDSEVMEATRDLVMSADHFLTNAKERDEAGPGQFADSDGLPTYKGEAMYPDYYAMQVAVDFLADRLELPRHAVESEDDGE